MSTIIVFETVLGVSIMNPADCGMTIEEIGIKDVPDGIAFWIIGRDKLPDTPQYSWELDNDAMGKPAGYGTAIQEVESD